MEIKDMVNGGFACSVTKLCSCAGSAELATEQATLADASALDLFLPLSEVATNALASFTQHQQNASAWVLCLRCTSPSVQDYIYYYPCFPSAGLRTVPQHGHVLMPNTCEPILAQWRRRG